jgi:zinc D-Ala-D-Ala carboxypeptidase
VIPPDDLPAYPWAFKYFSRDELSCGCCGEARMDKLFVHRMDALREAFGAPLLVGSAYRCPEHNARVSITGRDGPHTTGHAIDIVIRGAPAHRLLSLALRASCFTGIGLRQHGPTRFIHFDDRAGPTRPTLWTYP